MHVTQPDRHLSGRLEDLRSVAEKLNIEIRYSNLKHDEFSIKSGHCKIQGQDLILIDKKILPAQQVQLLLDVLSHFDLEEIYVASWIREALEPTPSMGEENV